MTQTATGGAGASRPLLSVTVTNYNYEDFLPRALDSILGQTFADFELIVIDNASTDGSRQLLREYVEGDARIRLIEHTENQGALASLRESCDLARGRYRVHVDADDWVLEATAFEEQIRVLESHPQMSFVFSSMTMFGRAGEKLQVSQPFPADAVLTGEEALEAVLGFNITHSGMMIRLDSYRQTEGYPSGLPHVDDMLLAAWLCEVGDVGYLDRELYAFRQHGGNVHLKPQLRVVRDEVLPVIETVFDGPLGQRLPDRGALRRRVIRQALVHLPTQYIFAGDIAKGWRLYFESARVRPISTVFQPRTLSLVSRTLLGQRGHNLLRGAGRRLGQGHRRPSTGDAPNESDR